MKIHLADDTKLACGVSEWRKDRRTTATSYTLDDVTCGRCRASKMFAAAEAVIERENYERENASYLRARARGWSD